ncbi:MAG: hypothetical protein AB8A49_03765, partial [Prochlorococcus sp.]
MEPTSSEKNEKEPTALTVQGVGDTLPLTDIDSVEMLSPKLARKMRQKLMILWLLPFGFFTGIAMTLMTDMDTFARYGTLGAALIGGLLGLVSGWMGSYAAAMSVKIENPD